MSTSLVDSPMQLDKERRAQVLDLLLRQGEHIVSVESPPGAGKTALVEAVVAIAVRHVGLNVAVVAPRAEQTYDIIRRLASHYAEIRIQPFVSAQRPLPDDIAADPVVSAAITRAANVPLIQGVTIATAAKLATALRDLGERAFDLLIVDEAYQLPYKEFAPISGMARQVLLVGDPGQLPPLVRGDIARYEAARYKVHWAAPKELLRRFPNVPTVSLPITRRLPQDSVRGIQPSFYPNLPFVSAADDDERRLTLAAAGTRTQLDIGLDALASGASIVGLLLPQREFEIDEVDEELATLVSDISVRLRERGAEWSGVKPITEREIGCVDPHVASGAAIRRHLRLRGIGSDMMVNTPEIWQGLERPLMIVKHPLSGSSRFSSFELEPGRLCVMTSRHQVACIIVGREGIDEALEEHLHNCADRPGGAENMEWHGWNANQALWGWLKNQGRLFRAG